MDSESPEPEELGHRIRVLRGRRSRDRFAEQLGIHKNTLARYEKGERLPDAEMLHRLCSLCGVSADWLIHDQVERLAEFSNWCLPEHDQTQTANAPVLLHRKWLEAQQIEPDKLLIRAMQGDAMTPTLGDGDMLFIRLQNADPADGVCLLELDGQEMVKRLHGAGTRRAQLISDNPSYPAIALTDGGASLRIIGPVLWHLRRL